MSMDTESCQNCRSLTSTVARSYTRAKPRLQLSRDLDFVHRTPLPRTTAYIDRGVAYIDRGGAYGVAYRAACIRSCIQRFRQSLGKKPSTSTARMSTLPCRHSGRIQFRCAVVLFAYTNRLRYYLTCIHLLSARNLLFESR